MSLGTTYQPCQKDLSRDGQPPQLLHSGDKNLKDKMKGLDLWILKDNFSHSEQVIKLINIVYPEGKHK